MHTVRHQTVHAEIDLSFQIKRPELEKLSNWRWCLYVLYKITLSTCEENSCDGANNMQQLAELRYLFAEAVSGQSEHQEYLVFFPVVGGFRPTLGKNWKYRRVWLA